MRTRSAPFALFGVLLPLTLAGYLFANKSFAYLHVPGTPIFIGEVLLLVAVVEVFRGRRLLRRLLRRSRPLQVLVAFMLLGLLRVAFFDIPAWGLVAVRDSAIWYYAVFALLVGAAILARPELLATWQRWYGSVLPAFLLWTPIAIILGRVQPLGATVPDSTVSILSFKPGDYGVHAAIAVAYVWLVQRPTGVRTARRRAIISVLGLVAILAASSQTRSGMLAAAVVLGGAWVLAPARAKLAFAIGGAALALLSLALAFDIQLELGSRTLSVKQIALNVTSIAGGDVGEQNLTDTVEWRQRLWAATVNDLVEQNPAFGLGFGPDLASRYGFGGTGLRSPHNSHLSVLARMGFVGLALWVLFWTAWTAAITRRRSDGPGARLRSWCVVAGIGIAVNAGFDPTLEGPQVAIWLWSLVGIAAASYVREQTRPVRVEEAQRAPLHAATRAAEQV